MSILDFTAAGTFANATKSAEDKDRQNANRVQSVEIRQTPGMHVRFARMLRHFWARAQGSAYLDGA